MRILILGGSGMIGHMLWQRLSLHYPETYTTLRKKRADYKRFSLFENDKVIDDIDASDFSMLKGILKGLQPQVVLNCIGVTKRHIDENNVIPCMMLNSLLPHYLAEWGLDNGVRIINFSTDCVFDGKLGNYKESSFPSADDLYGRTKALVITIGTMLLSDMVLGFHAVMWATYGGFALSVLLANIFLRKQSLPRVAGVTLASSIVFYLVTNFAVWFVPGSMYPKTFAGLLDSYIMALPFFRNSLVGDFFYTGVFFGGWELVVLLQKRLYRLHSR